MSDRRVSMNRTDTIFALSSGKLPSGVAAFRLSGARVRFVLETICGFVPENRVMRRVSMKDPTGGLIDRGLCVYFAAPGSFTGEDSAELHVHGSIAVAKKLAEVLSVIEGVRAADAGEFTKRAFLNGKIDLAEAEGLSDLIQAETDLQRRLALSQADGNLSVVFSRWRERLVHCRAMVEAAIDFAEEADVAHAALKSVQADIGLLNEEIRSWLKRSANSEMIRDGFKVVIIGAPNAGKSSLLNGLAGRDVAIISDEPGTTRDLIDVRLELAGNLVIVTDTAGIRTDAGKVETIGIGKAVGRAEQADLVVLLEDASAPLRADIGLPAIRSLRVGNKSDLGVLNKDDYDILISAKTGDGIAALVSKIAGLASVSNGVVEGIVVQQRQKSLLVDCCRELDACLLHPGETELVAEHLRLAGNYVGRLTGAVDVEELLGVIFSRFCIGK